MKFGASKRRFLNKISLKMLQNGFYTEGVFQVINFEKYYLNLYFWFKQNYLIIFDVVKEKQHPQL